MFVGPCVRALSVAMSAYVRHRSRMKTRRKASLKTASKTGTPAAQIDPDAPRSKKSIAAQKAAAARWGKVSAEDRTANARRMLDSRWGKTRGESEPTT